jgi:hypothetical protein
MSLSDEGRRGGVGSGVRLLHLLHEKRMLRTRRKVGSGSIMEITVAAYENRGPRPRRVLRTSARSEMAESFSERASAIFF